MRATAATTLRCNLRPTVEITRGPVRISRPAFALLLLLTFAAGLAGQTSLHLLLAKLFP